ncbi:hypothetical protein LJC18_02455 [Lachnospiraceae bacterium OttesenSCG-928-E19]|nr:hypothetical protein [Lachnospiraceae bacterium OttesenSCG-928-E19]
MSGKSKENLENIEKQRQLLLSGQYNSLFNDLTLNIPFRFIAYNKPEIMNDFFEDLFNKLINAKSGFGHEDAWTFDNVIRIIAPRMQFPDREHVFDFLIKTCRIPEGHINFNRPEQIPGHMFPERNIYLSRYAMGQIVNTLLGQDKGFQNDLNAELLIKPNPENFERGKNQFESEMRLMFSDYFFSHFMSDWPELTDNTWMRVRGELLRSEYSEAMKRFRLIINKNMKYTIDDEKIDEEMKYYRERFPGNLSDDKELRAYIRKNMEENFRDSTVEKFKQKFIFDTLFKQHNGPTFQQEYENALKSFGYEFTKKNPSDNSETKKWRKYRGDKEITAPKHSSTGALFTPDITFFMTWSINKFCDFIESERYYTQTKSRNKWFEERTNKFFMTLKEGLITESYAQYKNQFDFIKSNKFIDQHQYREAYMDVNHMRNGIGLKKTDKYTGEKKSEIPGTLEYWKSKPLALSENDVKELHYSILLRSNAQKRLQELHREYMENPSMDLLHKISREENDILFENVALYGFNFSGFVTPCVTLNKHGEFVPRKYIGPEKVITEFFPPLDKPQTLNPKSNQLSIFDQVAEPVLQIKPEEAVIKKTVTNTTLKKQIEFERIDFDKINSYYTGQNLISFLEDFLPGGQLRGREYSRASLYPSDTEIGNSFSYNIATGKFADFASDQSGTGVISLVMHAKGLNFNNKSDYIVAGKFLADWVGGSVLTETYVPTPKLMPKKSSGYLVPPVGTPAPEKIWFEKQYHNINQKWAYHNQNGRPVMYDCRLNLPNGKKVILPMKWGEYNGQPTWRNGAIPDNRPLYNLHIIGKYEIVCVSEGAKTADAISAYIKDAASVTWSGGSNAVMKSDWKSIRDKIVIIIPDADKKIAKSDNQIPGIKKDELLPWEFQPGQRAALQIAELLAPHNKIVHIVDTQPMTNIKDGWDIADAKEDNWTAEQVREFINIDGIIAGMSMIYNNQK